MESNFKAALVAITVLLGAVWLRVPKRAANTWQLAVLFSILGGLLGFWVDSTPFGAILGGAAGAVSPWIIKTLISGIRKIVRRRADQLAGDHDS